MRKRVKLATTAGVTVLGFTAMGGMSGTAQADTGNGLGLPDLTGPLAKTGPVGKTVDGVVKSVTGPSGLHLSLPVDVRLGPPPSSSPSKPSAPVVKAHVKADVKAAVNPVDVGARVNLRLCAGAPQQCGERAPSPPTPIPPAPPTPPPTPPVGNQPPAQSPGSGALAGSAGSLTVSGGSLPFTGGPIGTLALLGAASVVTGAAGVAGSRLRANRG